MREQAVDRIDDAAVVGEVQRGRLIAHVDTPDGGVIGKARGGFCVKRKRILLFQLAGVFSVAAPPAGDDVGQNGADMMLFKGV